MDAFYASVELRRRPELRGKPVVVCGSGPRAVVTTASYEARKLAGIHSAMPAAVARRRLPDAVYLRPDFPAYREASGQVMDILRGNVEIVEVVGLDEAYLDLTGLFSPKATMRRVQTEIQAETGLTCSVGISESRMLAKITSELGKPRGLVVLSREQALERFADTSPGLIPGIGPKTVSRLESLGVKTLSDLQSRNRQELESTFGPVPAPGCTRGVPCSTTRRSRPNTRRNRSRRRSPSMSTSTSAPIWSGTSASSRRSSAGDCANGSSRGARSGSRCGSTTGPTSPAPTRSTSRPTTRRSPA